MNWTIGILVMVLLLKEYNASDSTVVINEVFFGDWTEQPQFQFIELKLKTYTSVPGQTNKRQKVDLSGQCLVIINLDKERLQFTQQLRSTTQISDFFVIGWKNQDLLDSTPRPNLNFNIEVTSFPSRKNGALAILIVACSQPNDYNLFKISDLNRDGLFTTQVMKDAIQRGLKDMVVIGSPQKDRYWIEDIITAWGEEGIDSYILEEETEGSGQSEFVGDFSLGRCSDSFESYLTGTFKYTPATIGAANECSQLYPTFLPFGVTSISTPVSTSTTTTTTTTTTTIASGSRSASATFPTCPAACSRASVSASSIPNQFHQTLEQSCRTRFSVLSWIDLTIYQDPYQKWVTCGTDPADTGIYCRPCMFALNNKDKIIKAIPDFTFPRGKLPDVATRGSKQVQVKRTNEMLKDHEKNQMHETLRLFFENKLEPKKANLPTSNMIFIVYAGAYMKLSFKTHESFVETAKHLGVPLGTHHFSRASAAMMSKFIDAFLHKRFLTELVERKKPLSLMVDLSTGKISGVHELAIVIQYMDNHLPNVYLLGLVQSKETGEGMYSAFELFLDETEKVVVGFKQYVKDHLTLYISDGASSVSGEYNSFYSRVKAFSKFGVPKLHCLNHRLHLAYGGTVKNLWYHSELDYVVNEVGVYFGSKAYARLAILKEWSDAKSRKLLKVYKIRWVRGADRAYSNLMKEYSNVYFAAVYISDAPSNVLPHMTTSAKDHALRISERLQERNFFMAFCGNIDFLSILTALSSQLQQGTIALMGQLKNINAAKGDLTLLKTNYGHHEMACLRSIVFEDPLDEAPPDETDFNGLLDKYENWPGFLMFNGIQLTDLPGNESDNTNHKLAFDKWSTIKNSWIDKLLEHINKYFEIPEVELQSFFDPSSLPREASSIKNLTHTYAQESIKTLSERYDWDYDQLIKDWEQLLVKMVCEDYVNENVRKLAHIFWGDALNIDFCWTDNTKELIETLLTYAVGTQDVERTFSVERRIDNEYRANLHINTIQSLLRLSVNGIELADFKKNVADDIALAWVQDGHLASDDSRGVRGRNRRRGKKYWVNRLSPTTYFYKKI